MSSQFTLSNGDIYTDNGKGYYFRMDDAGKTRIKKSEFDEAHAKWEQEVLAHTVGTINNIADLVVEGVVEREKKERTFPDAKSVGDHAIDTQWRAEIEEYAGKRFDEATWDWKEDSGEFKRFMADLEVNITEKVLTALFGKKKKVRKQSVKIGGFEFTENGGVQIVLTPKQVEFIKALPATSYWQTGIDSILWIDVLCDELEMPPMTIGAMVTTLRQKHIITVGADKRETRKVKWFEFTDLGKVVLGRMGIE